MVHPTNPHEILTRLVANYPTQRRAADALGISQPYLNDLLQKRRTFSTAMLRKLGLKRIIVKARPHV